MRKITTVDHIHHVLVREFIEPVNEVFYYVHGAFFALSLLFMRAYRVWHQPLSVLKSCSLSRVSVL